MSRKISLVVLTVLFGAFCSPLVAAVIPTGGDFQASTVSLYGERSPSAAFLSGGRLLVVWENMRQGVYGRLVSTDERPLGNPSLLVANSELPPNPGQGPFFSRQEPSAVGLPGGGFLLFWTEEDSWVRLSVFHADTEVRDRDIYGQRFDALARPVGERFRVNQRTDGLQASPRAVLLPGNRVLVAWTGSDRYATVRSEADGVFVRLLDLSGAPLGDELRVDAGTDPSVSRVALAAARSGSFLVAWQGTDDDGTGIYARLYDAGFEPLSEAFRANDTTALNQLSPSVAASPDGEFLIAWQNEVIFVTENRIFGRVVGSDGALLGSELQLTPDLGDGDGAPAVAALPGGGYLLTYLLWAYHVPQVFMGVELDGQGVARSDGFQVSPGHADVQYRSSLAVTSDGRYALAWKGFGFGSQGIRGRVLRQDSPSVGLLKLVRP